MTPEQQRIKIAELQKTMRWSYALPERVVHCDVPNYLNSRDAMAEVLAGLTEGEKCDLQVGLVKLMEGKPWDTHGHWSDVGGTFLFDATPAQLAEAYLRTKGEWKE